MAKHGRNERWAWRKLLVAQAIYSLVGLAVSGVGEWIGQAVEMMTQSSLCTIAVLMMFMG